MRLFVALNLPRKERDRIYRGMKSLREATYPFRWVEPDHYHLTLKFLGEVHPERVAAIRELVEKVAAGTRAFDLEMKGLGAFPTLRRPRVLWLGADASPALRCLKHDVEWALSACGFERETRAFHPHLTLARCAEDGGAGVFRGLDDSVTKVEYSGTFPVKSVDLMTSKLSREGPQYSVLQSSPLGSEPPSSDS
jgi:RNA 2',3'-cyclic 3'-phosphodiesterase